MIRRRENERIIFQDVKSGQRITLMVTAIESNQVQLGIEADPEMVKVWREELMSAEASA